jgi:hypothetical protein
VPGFGIRAPRTLEVAARDGRRDPESESARRRRPTQVTLMRICARIRNPRTEGARTRIPWTGDGIRRRNQPAEGGRNRLFSCGPAPGFGLLAPRAREIAARGRETEAGLGICAPRAHETGSVSCAGACPDSESARRGRTRSHPVTGDGTRIRNRRAEGALVCICARIRNPRAEGA